MRRQSETKKVLVLAAIILSLLALSYIRSGEDRVVPGRQTPAQKTKLDVPKDLPTKDAEIDPHTPLRDPRAYPLPPPPNDGLPFPLPGKVINEKCYLPLNRSYCAPTFAVIGAMKSGTTSLFGYLLEHPEMLPLRPTPPDFQKKTGVKPPLANKEIRFFNDHNLAAAIQQNGFLGAQHVYLNLFEEILPTSDEIDQVITGEATPMYICQHRTAESMYRLLPHAKLILMLRNPVDRVYSEFWFRRALKVKPPVSGASKIVPTRLLNWDLDADRLNDDQLLFRMCCSIDASSIEECDYDQWDPTKPFYNGQIKPRLEPEALRNCTSDTHNKLRKENKNPAFCSQSPKQEAFCDASSDCTPHGLRNGIYAPQIAPWLQYYPRKNIMVIRSEDFYNDTPKVMHDVQEFLGLSEFPWETVTSKAFNIMNPKTPAGRAASFDHGNIGLSMGTQAVGEVSNYEMMDPLSRQALSRFFHPFNVQLSQLLGTPLFWDVDYEMGQ